MLLFLLCSSMAFACSGMEQTEHNKVRAINLSGDYLYRTQDQMFFTPPPPEPQQRRLYPWEQERQEDLKN